MYRSDWFEVRGGRLKGLALGCAVLAGLSGAADGQILGLGKPTAPVTIPTLEAPQAGYVFPQKETLTFSVDWRVFNAGTAVFHLEQQPSAVAGQGETMKVTAAADTAGNINMVFPVIDKFESSFDTKTGCSSGFSKQLSEGRRKVTSDLTFANGRQEEKSKNLVKGTSTERSASIPACVQDTLSAIFYVASRPLVVGQQVRFPLADSMRTVTVAMKVEGKEEIKTPAGTFQTVRVQPTADEGIVKNRGNIRIWYTDDAKHIPVQIRAQLFWGTITFHLQTFETK